MQLIFLLEEPSMKEVLDILLPKILPEDVEFRTISHNGKKWLETFYPTQVKSLEVAGHEICHCT